MPQKPTTQRIIAWLSRHQGWHTPTEIGKGIREKNQQHVASTLLYLHRHGRIARVRGDVNNGPGSSQYGALSDPTSTVQPAKKKSAKR